MQAAATATSITLTREETDAVIATLRECNTILMHLIAGNGIERSRVMEAGQMLMTAAETLRGR